MTILTSHAHRDTYRKMDMDKSYPSLFELLWYSQLPCFDVVNVTTTNEEDEYGKRAKHSFAFIIDCIIHFVTVAFCASLFL